MTQRHEDSDDDTYVTIGAAFEKLETDEDVQKEKRRKEKEQYVTDSKGRRRFHGAFTGGFSAGYFNTVGSEEGWTPSSFVSSREKKSAFSQQKPEDFMDEEDLGVYGIAPRAISAKEEYDQQKVGSKRSAESLQPSVIPGVAPLQNLIVPAKSSIGARLLKAMGWREGEGVGPKELRYGPAQKESHEDSENMAPPGKYSKAAEGFMFAPRDVTPWQVEAKDDMHGIGYRGIQELGVLSTQKSTKALYGMSGEAFGIGALEEDEDEDNVYGVESMTSYHSTLAGEGDISMERKYGWTGGHESDWGLSSFNKASKQRTDAKRYPPPQVPRDFVPVHKFGSATAAPSEGAANHHRHQKPLTSADRTHMLSDKPGSVFSLLSAADRDRLKKLTEKTQDKDSSDTNKFPHELGETKAHTGLLQNVEFQSKEFSADKLKPFVRDPDKQVRYEAFLTGKGPQQSPGGSHMTEWEKQKEREEFAKTARVFQPLNTTLASRFTRSQDRKTDTKEKDGIAGRPESPESDAVQAAKANMFGILTRETEEWHPHRILCKRFNVPDPYPGSSTVGVSKGNEVRYSDTAASSATKRSIDFLHTERLIPIEQPEDQESQDTELTEESSTGLESEDHSVEPQLNPSVSDVSEDTKEDSERPPMDLFKSIFAESSSESEAASSDSDMETEQKNTVTKPSNVSSSTTFTEQQKRRWQDLSTFASKPLPTIKSGNNDSQRSDSAKTDLQTLSQRTTNEHATTPKNSDSVQRNALKTESLESPLVLKTDNHREDKVLTQNYGPALPPDYVSVDVKSDNSRHGDQANRRNSDSSKHKRSHSDHKRKSHKKEGTKDHKKRKHKHSRHK